MAEAEKSEPNDPNAMIVATATPDGHPSLRAILLKGVDERGFVFYTNKESRKGDELAANPNVALLFHWKSLQRQIRIEGAVEAVTDAEADAYYAVARADFPPGCLGVTAVAPVGKPNDSGGAAGGDGSSDIPNEIPRPGYWSGFGCCRKCSNSGRICRIVCMTGRYIAGRRRGWEQSKLFP